MTEAAERRVLCADAFEWLAANPAEPEMAIVTSLPDISELALRDVNAYRTWFTDATSTLLRWLPPEGFAVFFQSDVRFGGVWLDKGYLALRAAELEGAALVWHKIVCRLPAGTPSLGRATYSHLICLARGAVPALRHASPDVLPDGGYKSWSRAMGVNACRLACRFLREETSARHVVDPFCGQGTVLAVANSLGLAATGVELSAKRCRAARRLVLPDGAEEATPEA